MARLLFCFRLSLWSALLVAAAATHANTYQFEGQLGYSESDDNEVDIENASAGLIWWFEPIDYQGKPWREAGFLARVSSVRLGYQRDSIERDGLTTTAIGTPVADRVEDTDDIADLAVRYFLPGDRWFGDLSAGLRNGDSEQAGAPDADGVRYGVGLGYYLSSSTSLSLFADWEERKGSGEIVTDCEALGTPFLCVESNRTSIDARTVGYGLSIKHVGKILTQWFGIEATYGQTEVDTDVAVSLTLAPNRIFGIPPEGRTIAQAFSFDDGPTNFARVGLAWYPSHRFRLGVDGGYVEVDVPNADDVYSYGLNLEWFAHRSIGLSVGVSRQESPTALQDDTTTIVAGLRVRI